jgi:hypothetical protein
LLRVIDRQKSIHFDFCDVKTESPPPAEIKNATAETKKKPVFYDKDCAKKFNRLAREKMKQNILSDILIDLTVCEIEGFDKKEYIKEIQILINSIVV